MYSKIGIICAGDRELAPFLLHLENTRLVEKAMLKIYEGDLNGIPVVTLFSGVCKVNAAIAAQILFDRFGVDAIINAGTAGGMHPALQIFDTVVSTEVAYHDVAGKILTAYHPWLDSVWFQADANLLALARSAAEKQPAGHVHFGRMVTGESFIADDGRDAINTNFEPLSVDMETAAIAHVCHANGIPFLAVRTITDTADHSGSGHFEQNCAQASVISKDFVLALLDEMKSKA